MNSFVRIATILLFSFAASSGIGYAFRLQDVSFAEKYDLSDVILVGRVVSSAQKVQFEGRGRRSVKFLPELTMKGKLAGEFELFISGAFSDLNFKCCVPGEKYLLFLHRVDDRHYVSVRGRYGVYKLARP